MRKKKKINIWMLLCLLLAQPITVFATESTTYTYTTSVDGDWIRTQDAYLTGEVLFQNEELLQPEDIFYRDGILYILDTGNRRVGKYNLETKELEWLEIEGLSKPTGIFVTEDGDIYIADYSAECVYGADAEGNVFLTISRPDSYLFSDSSRYKPKNVVVTSGGTIYVVGEGSYEGIMQFNSEGEFEGYYAANTTPMTFLEKIEELIFSEEQLEALFNRSPRAIYNIDLTDLDLLFSVTQDSDAGYSWSNLSSNPDNNVKLHNYAGNDIFSSDELIDEWNFVDVAAKADGGCLTVTYTGLINDYDPSGNLLFSFGGSSAGGERNGLFTYATAICTDDDGYIYVLDREKAMVQVFYPTEFALMTYEAIEKTDEGDYEASGELWAELVSLNGMSRIAHNGYGKSLYFQGEYEAAMKHFKLAGNQEDYSEAFWEVRDQWINDHGALLVAGVIVLYILYRMYGLWKKKRADKESKRFLRLRSEVSFMNLFVRHPIDSTYAIKRQHCGSVWTATALYVVLVVIYMWDYLFRGFIFNSTVGRDVSVPVILAVLIIPVGLFVVGSYMIGTIREGEGSFRNVYVSTAYALLPYIAGGAPVLLLTYVLSENESFVFVFLHSALLVWCAVNIFLATMEVHNYGIRETVVNLLITLFFIIMAVVAFVILYLIWLSVWDYLHEVIEEVRFRVIG